MQYRLLWPSPVKPPQLSTGVAIYYYMGEEEQLLHLLQFLEQHFQLTEKDFGKTINRPQKRLPIAWDEGGDLSIKRLIRYADDVAVEGVGGWIGIGFYDRHQIAFRAYKKHLDKGDNPELESVKKFFDEAERCAFGRKEKLH